MVFDVFRCAVCGSVGLNSGTCGVCSGVVRDIREDTSGSLTTSGSIVRRRVAGQRVRPFWTATKIVASIIVVVVAVSSVGAGLYISARPSGPSCRNLALNYPSCNSCYSKETYNLSADTCICTSGAVNPPACNRFCANNAINPPNCDRCPDNHTDVVCPPSLPLKTSQVERTTNSTPRLLSIEV